MFTVRRLGVGGSLVAALGRQVTPAVDTPEEYDQAAA
jgi:hypothetical protein